MKLKDIIVNNFTYPLTGSEYLKVLTNGVIDVNAAETYGTSYTDKRIVSLDYLQDMWEATRVEGKQGRWKTESGAEGTYINLNYETGDFLGAPRILSNSTYHLLVTNLPAGKGIIARVDCVTGTTLTFGGTSNVVLVAEATGCYYIGFVSWIQRPSFSQTRSCIDLVGIKKAPVANVDLT